jgi:conjugal transfer pilus assembly protein TraK
MRQVSQLLRASPAIGLLTTILVALSPPSHADSPFLRTGSGSDPSGSGTSGQQAVLALGPRTVTVRPGANAILELAIDHLNRIVTPFSRPSVRTVSSLSTEVDGNVLYVATAEETPATLYISDGDDARTTIGLTLAPRRVPPREIRLQVPGVKAGRSTSLNDTAQDQATAPTSEPIIAATWRQPQRYVEELTAGFRSLALGEAPDGYSERRTRSSETLSCGDGLRIRRGRAFDGGPLRFITAKITARSSDPISLNEQSCRLRSGDAIAAVALWPSRDLPPGAAADLIVAVRLEDREDDMRRSGLGGRP